LNKGENLKVDRKNVNIIISLFLDEYVHDFEWTPEMEENAKKIIDENPETLDENYLKEHLDVQNKNWEKFYKFNKTNFFKDRHYILKEFAELKDDERVRNSF
jgi:hypothetical protein